MAADKVFEKGDVLEFFNEDTVVGEFTSVAPKGQLALDGNPQVDIHSVHAYTRSMFIEKERIAIVMSGVALSRGGDARLPKEHWYRSQDSRRTTVLNDQNNNAALVRRVAQMADDWQDLVVSYLPAGAHVTKDGDGAE